MDKKSKIFFVILGLLIVGSVAVTYWRIMIKKDYIIEAQTDCDPTTEACFVWECDPESDEEGEACTGDPEMDIWYYEIVRRNASRIPLCDPADEDCEALVCGEDEPECEYIFCDDKNKEEQGVECNDPEVYVAENPIEEVEDPSASSGQAGQEEEEVCAEGEICPTEIVEADGEGVVEEDVVTTGEDEIVTAEDDIVTTSEDVAN